MGTPESLKDLKDWHQFETMLRTQVWGRAAAPDDSLQMEYDIGKKFEEIAIKEILPKEGFTDIVWLSENNKSFPIDAVADRSGQRILIEITTATQKKIASKMWFVTAMHMPLIVLHISTKNPEVYYIQDSFTGAGYSNIPARFMHGLAVKAGIQHDYIPAKVSVCAVCGSQYAKYSNRPTKVCGKKCLYKFLGAASKARNVRPPYLTDLSGSARPGAKLHESDISQIKQMLIKGMGTRTVSKMFNVSNALIRGIKDGSKWKHIT